MGGDGQALQNKRSLLQKSKLYERETDPESNDGVEKQTEKERRIERWNHCALSLEPLEFPVAFDLAGNIFSKQAVVEALTERRTLKGAETEADTKDLHDITKLSDVRDIENEMDPDKPAIRCAVTGVSAAAGIHNFVGFWGCGHVVSSSTVEGRGDEQLESVCPLCGEESCVVKLIVESEKDARSQRKQLRSFLRAKRKRARESSSQ